MTLGELKSQIESAPDGTVFNYSLSEPFSWRGVYAEVAFSIEEESSTKEDLLSKINQALTDEFTGYKGGEFYYRESTDVHFERDYSAYSDGGYTEKWIAKITGEEPKADLDKKLVTLLFNS